MRTATRWLYTLQLWALLVWAETPEGERIGWADAWRQAAECYREG